MLLHCGHFDKNEFRVKCYVNAAQKWNHVKGNICACEYVRIDDVVFELQSKLSCAKETKHVLVRLSSEANNKKLHIFRCRFVNDTNDKILQHKVNKQYNIKFVHNEKRAHL